jgi:hypothetical protein
VDDVVHAEFHDNSFPDIIFGLRKLAFGNAIGHQFWLVPYFHSNPAGISWNFFDARQSIFAVACASAGVKQVIATNPSPFPRTQPTINVPDAVAPQQFDPLRATGNSFLAIEWAISQAPKDQLGMGLSQLDLAPRSHCRIYVPELMADAP